MIKETILLAGGMGKRLGPITKNIPKPMAEIAGRPFLEYLLDYLTTQRIKRVILAVGYKYETIIKHFGGSYKGLELIYSVEDEPLGTGGAIKKALIMVQDDDFFILNGDTYFNIPLARLYDFHKLKNGFLSVAIRPLKDFYRYGTVELDSNGKIVRFREKGYRRKGMINGGVYLLRGEVLRKIRFPTKFSFEKDFLERYSCSLDFYGLPFAEAFFIDIGIPEDFIRAQDALGACRNIPLSKKPGSAVK